MSPRQGGKSWFGDLPEASQGVPAFMSLCGCVARLSRCQLLYLCSAGKDTKKLTGKYCQLRKADFFFIYLWGCVIFYLDSPGCLAFQLSYVLHIQRYLSSLAYGRVWLHLNMCIRKYIYGKDSWLMPCSQSSVGKFFYCLYWLGKAQTAPSFVPHYLL